MPHRVSAARRISARTSVLFPLPLGPTTAVRDPRRASNDTPDKLDYDRFALVVSGMEKVIQGLDKL